MSCKNFRKTVKKATDILDDALTTALDTAHKVTTVVAKIINDPSFQLIYDAIPGSDKKKVLNVIIETLEKTNKVVNCQQFTDPIDKANCMLGALNVMTPDERNKYMLALKVAVTATIDGNRYKSFVYDTAAQTDYFNRKLEAGSPVNA